MVAHMQVALAQFPEQSDDDRVLVTKNAVMVLDGSSGSGDGSIRPGTFAGRIGQYLAAEITQNPVDDLKICLERALDKEMTEFGLHPGARPSTTISIFRLSPGQVEVLVLGDSPVIVGGDNFSQVITDSRLDDLDLEEVRKYRERLQSGSGYDLEHERLVEILRQRQRDYRNRPGGFWVACDDPKVARNALVTRFDAAEVRWAVMATDGAAKPLMHLGWDDWGQIAQFDSAQLKELLERCHSWEAENDSGGVSLPRAKCHDDKTIVAINTNEELARTLRPLTEARDENVEHQT